MIELYPPAAVPVPIALITFPPSPATTSNKLFPRFDTVNKLLPVQLVRAIFPDVVFRPILVFVISVRIAV